jgi:hypothetical protein
MKIDISQLSFESFFGLMMHREFARLVYDEITGKGYGKHIAACLELVKKADGKIPAIKAVRTYSQQNLESIAVVEEFMGEKSSETRYFGLALAKHFVERLVEENGIKWNY